MSEIHVRPYRHDADYAGILELWQASGLKHDPEGRDSPEAIARQIAYPTAVYLVAEADEQLLGVLLATHDGRKGWLNRAAVHPDHQRRGVISALVTEAERRFQENGVSVSACLVEDWNEISKAGSIKLGYQPCEITYFRKVLD